MPQRNSRHWPYTDPDKSALTREAAERRAAILKNRRRGESEKAFIERVLKGDDGAVPPADVELLQKLLEGLKNL